MTAPCWLKVTVRDPHVSGRSGRAPEKAAGRARPWCPRPFPGGRRPRTDLGWFRERAEVESHSAAVCFVKYCACDRTVCDV